MRKAALSLKYRSTFERREAWSDYANDSVIAE
jgi:hypothetical protein